MCTKLYRHSPACAMLIAAWALAACSSTGGDQGMHSPAHMAGASRSGEQPADHAMMGGQSGGMMGGGMTGGAHPGSGAGSAGSPGQMEHMDMAAMCDMYRKMQSASPEQRQAMMAEQMKGMSPEMRQQHMDMMRRHCQ